MYIYVKRALIVVLIGSLGLGLFGCKAKKSVEPELTKVQVKTLQPQVAINSQVYPGLMVAANKMSITAETGGRLKKVYVEIGQHVQKGQLLGVMDATIDEGRYIQAKSAYDLANVSYKRQTALYKEKVIAKQQYDAVVAQYRQAYGAYIQAKRGYDDCFLRAPLSGTVAFVYYDVGDSVPQNRAVFMVVNYKTIHMTVGVPDTDIAKIKRGKTATVTVDGLSGKTFKALVVGAGVMADEQTGAYPVKLVISNASGLIKPGMFGRAKIALDYYAKAPVVSLDAIVLRGEEKGLYVLGAGKTVQFSPITVAFEFGEKAMIKTKVKYGSTYVVSGQDLLADGQAVAIVTENQH